jgi:Uma2 family endonuclease
MAFAERRTQDRRYSAAPRPFLITKPHYYKMGADGFFNDLRVELIEGKVVVMSPIGSRHWVAVNRLNRIFTSALGSGFTVSVQNSIDTSSLSEPVPDLAIVSGNEIDYIGGLPQTAVLAIEVSDTTIRHDRRKIDLYARAGIPEYWIVNLKADCIEVYREPSGDRETPGTGKYAKSFTVGKSDAVSALAAPDVTVDVANLIP